MSFFESQIQKLQLNVDVSFGLDSLAQLVAEKKIRSAILITSASFARRGIAARIVEELSPLKVHTLANVSANPKIEEIETQFSEFSDINPDLLIALGGGSVIDSAKALSRRFSLSSKLSLMEHLQHSEAVATLASIPIIAIPTTSGTGSEVTPFATVWSQEFSKKFSVTGLDLLPINVILDPRLTDSLPKEVTLSSGLDTVSHALESFWNKNRSEESSRFAIGSLELSLTSLPKLMNDLNDPDARDRMMLSSFLGGLAIAQTKTAIAHAMSYPLTAIFGIPHGIACSFALPQILEFNAEISTKEFIELANRLNYQGITEFSDGLQELLNICNVGEEVSKHLNGKHELMEVIDQMQDPARAGNNLREVTANDLRGILADATTRLNVS
jgi:phosphonate metabolism-associated iron-containing alcohol dehydrogenase